MGRIAEEEREKVQVRLDKIEQIFCINSGDFIPKSRNYECTNGGAVALANIFCWAAALLLNIPYCTFLVLLIKIRHRKTTITTKQNGDLRIVMQIFLQYRLQKNQLLRCRNTVFHHTAGSLSDPRSFHHNRQLDDNHCSDSES